LLTHPTLDQMHQLGLAGMARAFAELEANPQSVDLSHAEWLGLLLDREATERYERRLRARLRYARLRHQAAVEDVDYRVARGLDRTLFQALIAGRWIEETQNLIIEGPAGVGKSWLACALGHKACRDNRSVLYQRIPRMFSDLALARGRRPLSSADARARRRQAAHSRRLGPGAPRARAASRSARDRRRPLRPRRHPDHKPDPGRSLARPDR
jgi:DNA replication protein DnaC